jgi:hypothetical protein
MATEVARGDDIGFTILPYSLETKPVKDELKANPDDRVLGYVTYDEETGKRTFTYTESGVAIETEHWCLKILKEFPYAEESGPWIVYNCNPEKVIHAFGKILGNYAQSLHIYNWDLWRVQGKDGLVAVVTSWEHY